MGRATGSTLAESTDAIEDFVELSAAGLLVVVPVPLVYSYAVWKIDPDRPALSQRLSVSLTAANRLGVAVLQRIDG